MRTTYNEKKNNARAAAIQWMDDASEKSLSYGEIAEAQAHFEKMARRYGLVKEFMENGVI